MTVLGFNGLVARWITQGIATKHGQSMSDLRISTFGAYPYCWKFMKGPCAFLVYTAYIYIYEVYIIIHYITFHHIILYYIILYYIIFYFILYYNVLHHIIVYYIILLFCITWYYMILYYIILYYIIDYCICIYYVYIYILCVYDVYIYIHTLCVQQFTQVLHQHPVLGGQWSGRHKKLSPPQQIFVVFILVFLGWNPVFVAKNPLVFGVLRQVANSKPWPSNSSMIYRAWKLWFL